MSDKLKTELTVYVRSGCHLCEDMVDELQLRQASLGFSLQIVDIAGKPELEPLYGTKVPVLRHKDEEICHYFLDEVSLLRCFENR